VVFPAPFGPAITYTGGVTLGGTGAVGQAVTFDGSSGFAKYVPVDTLTGSFTVEMWVKPTLDNHTVLFTTWGSGGQQFDMQRDGGRPHGDVGTGSTWLTTGADSPTPLNLNQWTHLVYAITSNGWTIYMNGAQSAAGSFSGTPLLFNPSTPVRLATHDEGSLFLGGMLDEVAIYPTALSAARVAAHYGARTASCQTSGCM
jgi:hypothetical protein